MTSLGLSQRGLSSPIFSDDLYLKRYKKAPAQASVLYHSLNTSMVLPVEPEFEQVLLFLIHLLLFAVT